jgi:DnaK suppressor protein
MPKRIRQDKLCAMLQEKKRKMLSHFQHNVFKKLGNDYRGEFERAMDAGDESFVDVLQSIDIKLVDIHPEDLNKIVEAERKPDEGAYGACQECGRDIGDDRLAALPYAVRCVEL